MLERVKSTVIKLFKDLVKSKCGKDSEHCTRTTVNRSLRL
jgi:hypothetical protein